MPGWDPDIGAGARALVAKGAEKWKEGREPLSWGVGQRAARPVSFVTSPVHCLLSLPWGPKN